MMQIININGPINAGKTTVSKILQTKLKNVLFIEVDDLLSDEEQESLHLSIRQGWTERLRRLDEKVVREKKLKRYQNIIFAYPMTDKMFYKWKKWEDEITKFINITLAPKEEICLQNRGTRTLTEREKMRIQEMYREGYHKSAFADLIIDNSAQTPDETACEIMDFLDSIGCL